jgi:hypothetical protein
MAADGAASGADRPLFQVVNGHPKINIVDADLCVVKAPV